MNKKMMNALGVLAIVAAMTACGGDTGNTGGNEGANRRTAPGAPGASEEGKKSDDNMFQPGDVELGELDQSMVDKGKSIYDVKCQACHSTGPNRVVGPGWQNITERREPHWIMNMILNIDVMLATDPEAQAQLEECLVRMPNQGLSQDEGRQVLEFMRTL